MSELTPQQRIETDLKAAMKAGEKEKVATLRMILAELKNERIRRGDEVDEAGFIAILRKAIKQREEAAEQYDKGGRAEQADHERREAAMLQADYLPKGPSEEEIRTAVEEVIAAQGLSGMAAMGQVMPVVIQHFEGRADNAVISKIAREVLSS